MAGKPFENIRLCRKLLLGGATLRPILRIVPRILANRVRNVLASLREVKPLLRIPGVEELDPTLLCKVSHAEVVADFKDLV
jgi:hypothetical protein